MDCTTIIGEKIKSIRNNQKMSIQELAERTGLTMEQVSRIEENVDIPSLTPLMVSSAFPFRQMTGPSSLSCSSKKVPSRTPKARAIFISFSNHTSQEWQHMHYHSLAKNKIDRHMAPFIIDIENNNDRKFFLSDHEGEEFIMVLKGELEITYGKSTYLLKEGDTIYYDALVPHHIHAANGKPAQILAVIYLPS